MYLIVDYIYNPESIYPEHEQRWGARGQRGGRHCVRVYADQEVEAAGGVWQQKSFLLHEAG